MQQKFDSLNNEYNTILEQNRQYEQKEFSLKSQHIEEMKQLKANLEKEKLEKNEREKSMEELREKLRAEQNQHEKIQQELKNIQPRYDAMQLELLQLHKKKENEPIVLESSHPPPSTTTRLMRSKRSAHDEVRSRSDHYCSLCVYRKHKRTRNQNMVHLIDRQETVDWRINQARENSLRKRM